MAGLRKELTWNIQSATPRFRVKRVKVSEMGGEDSARVGDQAQLAMIRHDNKVLSSLVMMAPQVTAAALDDDGRAAPMFISSWIGDVQLPKTLVDGGSLVELIAEKVVPRIKATVYSDEGREISLADNTTTVLRQYIHIPVNV